MVNSITVKSNNLMSAVPIVGTNFDPTTIRYSCIDLSVPLTDIHPDMAARIRNAKNQIVRWNNEKDYNWKDFIGPWQDRQIGKWTCEPGRGINEYVKCIRSVGIKDAIIVVPLSQGAESAADWVRYCNIENGYGIRYWELENEPYYSDISPSQYASIVPAFIAAMKAVDPTIQIGIPLRIPSWGWNTSEILNLTKIADWCSIHWYSLYDNYSAIQYSGQEPYLLAFDPFWYADGISKLKNTLPRDIPLFITEMNLGYQNGNMYAYDTAHAPTAACRLKTALWLGAYIHSLAKGGVAAAIHHCCADSGYWGAIRLLYSWYNDGPNPGERLNPPPTLSSVYDTLPMYAEIAGCNLVDIDVQCPKMSWHGEVAIPSPVQNILPIDVPVLDAIAARRSSGTGNTSKTTLMVVNWGPDIDVKVQVGNTLKPTGIKKLKVITFAGGNSGLSASQYLNANNEIYFGAKPDVVGIVQDTLPKVKSGSFVHRFAGYSITQIALERPSLTIKQEINKNEATSRGIRSIRQAGERIFAI